MDPVHPLYAIDADVGCRWLALSAGRRTASDERVFEEVLKHLPYQGKAVPSSVFSNRIY